MSPSVTYLGYRIDSEGLHPTDEKLKAVQQAPEPTSVTELKAYLGLLTYYGRFLPHLPSVLAPLYALLHKDAPWRWTTVEQESFQQSKELLLSSTVLVHFNPDLPIVLACDASSYVTGPVLSPYFVFREIRISIFNALYFSGGLIQSRKISCIISVVI